MRHLSGPAGTLAVEEHGQGPLPVLLVHGMAGEAGFWSSTIRALGPTHRLIVPELAGAWSVGAAGRRRLLDRGVRRQTWPR
ncbi:MAG: hypothetical protein V9E87_16865 [Gemmatimonadales bacterium]